MELQTSTIYNQVTMLMDLLELLQNYNKYIFSNIYIYIYDTDIIPFSYTGSEDIDIVYNQISLSLPIKINDEVVLNPRAYDGAVFDMLSGTDNFVVRQNSIHGGTLIAQFNPSTK